MFFRTKKNLTPEQLGELDGLYLLQDINRHQIESAAKLEIEYRIRGLNQDADLAKNILKGLCVEYAQLEVRVRSFMEEDDKEGKQGGLA